MNPYPLIPLLSWLLILFVWSYVLGQRRRDAVSSAFLLFAGVAGAWNGLELLFHVPAFEGLEDAILRAVIPLWMSIGFLFLNFAYRLVGRKVDAIYWIALLGTLGGALVDLTTDWILLGHQRYDWGVADLRDPVAHTVVCTAPVLSGLFGLWLVFDAWRKTTDPQIRRPIAMVALGGLATLTAISTLNIALPNLAGMIDFPRFGSSALALFVFVIFAAVTRYRFLSISVEQVAEELFEDVRDGIVLLDQSGHARRMNRAATELMGLGRPPDSVVQVAELLPGYPPESDFQNREIVLGRGQTRRVLSVSQSSNHKQGIELGKILILRDVTEQKRAEELMRSSHEELEEEMRRRTEELRQAQKMEAIGTLAGGIAHDFNNLLAAILGFATAARDEMPREHPLRSDLEEVVVAARRARDIVQQLLTFSRRGEPERKVVSVSQVLGEALKLLEISLPPKIAIRREIDEQDCLVFADPSQLHQVVMNLCTNAYQSMGDAGGELGVVLEVVELDREFATAHPPLRPTRHVRVTVNDTGHGMSEATVAQIFDPFFTTKSDGGGTGLGLATVQRIVHDHGGAIAVESELGAGSKFSIYLPWVEGDPALEDSTSLPVEGGNERILFVDDREQVARASRRLLETLGYRVETLTSPSEALEAFTRDPRAWDLVITDQVMPEMTGLELAGEMLRIRPQLPIILVSGQVDAEIRVRARELGIGAFLPKPLAKGSADRAIRAVLDGYSLPTPR